jgi:hypothetical protein
MVGGDIDIASTIDLKRESEVKTATTECLLSPVFRAERDQK